MRCSSSSCCCSPWWAPVRCSSLSDKAFRFQKSTARTGIMSACPIEGEPAMGKKLAAIVLVTAPLAILLAATPAVAHHAFAADFDANAPVTLTGAGRKIEWGKPHSWVHIDVKGT